MVAVVAKNVFRAIQKAATRAETRARAVVGRFLLRAISDATNVQTVQISGQAGFELDEVERFQQYGFTSVPVAGAEAVGVAVGGSRDHIIVVATDDRRYRPKNLAPGEVALYDKNGLVIALKADGIAHIGGAAPTYEAADFIALAAKVLTELNDIRTKHDDHTHSYIPGTLAAAQTVTPTTPMGDASSVAATKAKAT